MRAGAVFVSSQMKSTGPIIYIGDVCCSELLSGQVVSKLCSEKVLSDDKSTSGVNGGIVAPQYDNSKGEGVNVYTVEIVEILRKARAPKVIHYMSLDVEGAESLVFAHIPFKTTIYMMTIERPKNDILVQLSELGYVEVGILGSFGDTMYLNRRTPRFHERLKVAQVQLTSITKARYKFLSESEVQMEVGSFRYRNRLIEFVVYIM